MGLRGIWGTVWALTFISATQVDAQESGGTSTETINLSQYVSGGTVGTAVGFGIGHALVGEYARIGWVFTMTEVLSVGLISGGCALRIEERRSRPQSEQNPYDRSSIGLAGLLLIDELVDFYLAQECDYASNCQEPTLPDGLGCGSFFLRCVGASLEGGGAPFSSGTCHAVYSLQSGTVQSHLLQTSQEFIPFALGGGRARRPRVCQAYL